MDSGKNDDTIVKSDVGDKNMEDEAPVELRQKEPKADKKRPVLKTRLSQRWTEIAKELVTSPDENRRLSRDGSGGESPRVSSLGATLLEDINQGNTASWDPETCVTLLRVPTVTNFAGIKKLLMKTNNEWMTEFLTLGGLSLLFEALSRTSEKSLSLSVATLQLEVVNCLRAVMNSKAGLDHMIEEKSYTRQLASGLESAMPLVRQQVWQFLSALCVYSDDGHQLALDALSNHQVHRGKRWRMQVVVDQLKEAETDEFRTVVMAFINSLVLGAESTEERCAIRDEMIGLDLLQIIENIKHPDRHNIEFDDSSFNVSVDSAFDSFSTGSSPADIWYGRNELGVQARVFEEYHEKDLEERFGENYDSSANQYHLFNTLFGKVRDTPHSQSLLMLLYNLSQLNVEDTSCDKLWTIINTISGRAATGVKESEWIGDDLTQSSVAMKTVSTQTIVKPAFKIHANENGSTGKGSVPPPPPPPPGSGPPPPPPPPPPPGSGPPPPPPPPPGSGPPPPPPPPGSGPPPPPPPPGSGPPPPPPPPCSGPPPPPPPPGSGPPPPPPPGSFPLGIIHQPIQKKFAATANAPVFINRIPRPSKKMRSLHWSKLRGANQDKSIWKHVVTTADKKSLESIDYTEIEQLFSQVERKKVDDVDSPHETHEKASKKESSITFLDGKTSMNLNITLRAFKASHQEIADKLTACDSSKFNIDHLRSLAKVLPEKQEVMSSQEYSSEYQKLATAEKFCFELSKVPLYELRINIMIQTSELEPSYCRLLRQLEAIKGSGTTVMTSVSLREFFAYILTLGNFLNTGSYAGNAQGFKLSTLVGVWETRSNTPGLTLLHHVVSKAKQQKLAILDFTEELQQLDDAAGLSIETLNQEVSDLKTNFKRIKTKLKSASKDLQDKFQERVKDCCKKVENLEDLVLKIEDNRELLAKYFCEDVSKFRSEDCLKIFHQLCTKIKDAEKENQKREELEERKRKRKQMAESRKKESVIKRNSDDVTRGETKKSLLPPQTGTAEPLILDQLLGEIGKGNFRMSRRRPKKQINLFA